MKVRFNCYKFDEREILATISDIAYRKNSKLMIFKIQSEPDVLKEFHVMPNSANDILDELATRGYSDLRGFEVNNYA